MKNLPIFFVTVIFVFVLLTPLHAQTPKPLKVGFQLQEIQGSFGLGLHLTLPLPSHWPSLRVAGQWHWLETAGEGKAPLSHFQTIRLGVAPDGWEVTDKIRVYGEGGALLILANSELADNAVTPGGYGLFGFEFFTSHPTGSSLYLEVGATSTGLRVARPDGIPRFGAGFLLGAGFRIAL